MAGKNEVVEQVAEQELSRWADEMDLDLTGDNLDEDDQKDLNINKRCLTRAIMRGALVIGEDGIAQYTPWRKASQFKDVITVREETGKTLAASDRVRTGRPLEKTNAVIASLCGVHITDIEGLSGPDYKVVKALFLFLVVPS